MTMNTADNVWKLLNDFEDLVRGNYRRPHSLMPAAGDAGPEARLKAIGQRVIACRACGLGGQRRNAVPGEGATDPRLVVVGEAPGAQEDESGRPFVGAAGQYLDKWLKAIGLSRETNAFIANVIKCRPPHNRDPEEGEIGLCFPFLQEQLAVLQPELIPCVGRFAARRLTGVEGSLASMRGRVHRFEGIPVIVTYHPSAVLRNQELRRPVWDDLKLAGDLLDDSKNT